MPNQVHLSSKTQKVFDVALALVSFNKRMDELKDVVESLGYPLDLDQQLALTEKVAEVASAWDEYIRLRTNVYGELFPDE